MHKFECFKCHKDFVHQPQIPCPDGRDGCLVFHTGAPVWTCTHCSHDNKPDYDAAWAIYKTANPDAVTWPIRQGIGIGAYNPEGLGRLVIPAPDSVGRTGTETKPKEPTP